MYQTFINVDVLNNIQMCISCCYTCIMALVDQQLIHVLHGIGYLLAVALSVHVYDIGWCNCVYAGLEH